MAEDTAAGGAAASGTAPVTQRAAHHPALRRAAGLGLLGYALIHLLVAWLALQLAWGPGRARTAGRSADSAGALDVLAESPLGGVLLWVLAAALAGLCLWQAVEVLRHHRRVPRPGPRRRQALGQLVKTVGTAVLYGFLAVSAGRAALGLRAGREQEQQTVRGVLSWPGGQLLVVAVALVVVGIGVYHVRKGWRADFLDEIDLSTVSPALCTLTTRLGQVGFVLKGVALVLVGAVVGWAAVTFDAETATGLDGALRALATGPLGPAVLTAVATGLATFSVYLLARARHPVG
jgi:succinate dehydrogenase/fumarate reductase cytochrome b subunit